MFKITKYLQFRNTLDDKPRVLVEGVDYQYQDEECLYEDFRELEDGIEKASLSECRPLLTVEIDGVEWTEGDILEWKESGTGKQANLLSFITEDPARTAGFYFDPSRYARGLCANQIWVLKIKKLGSFFDDPAKYSKLLWGCNEEEGWNKVFKLLGIK